MVARGSLWVDGRAARRPRHHRLPDLAAVLADVDERVLSAALSYRYPAAAVRRLDDALLARFGQEYVALPGNAHRIDLLRTRWRRLTGG